MQRSISLSRKMPKKPQSRNSRASTQTAGRVSVVTKSVSEESVPEAESLKPAPDSWRAVYALVPVLLALVTSFNTLWNHFAADDLEQVLNNTFIKTFSNLPAAFTSSVWSFTAADIVFSVDPYFRPIFTSLFTVNYALFDNRPFGWHLISILTHASVTFLVFMVSREVTERNWVAGLTASLFAVHPVHAESVAWISGITDPLMTLFLLPSFLFYLRFRKVGSWYMLFLSIGFFFLALLSKETAIAFPLVVGYYELFHFNREEQITHRLVRAVQLLAVFLVPALLYLAMRYYALGTVTFNEPRYPLGLAVLTVPLATLKYLGLMVVPWGYSYQHYTAFVETPFRVAFLVPLAAIIAIAAGIAYTKSKSLTLGAVWFIAMLSPALAALQQFEPSVLLQERYLYAPSIGVCLIITLGIEWIMKSFESRGRAVGVAFAVLLILIWSIVLVRQNRIWTDTVSVNRNSVAVTPDAPLAHISLSRSLYDAGRPREAEAETRTALNLDPRCAPAYLSLSYFARMSGKLDKACEILEEGISAVPASTMTRHDLATMYVNLGLLYQQRKMFDLAEEKLLRSAQISPRAVAWYYTGQFYFDQGRYDEARAQYEQTLAAVPRWFAPIHLRLGLTYEALKDSARAQTEFEKYLELAPDDAPDRDATRRHLQDMKGTPPKQ
jgi:tetratricopeptide (TPR) repeat protein